MEKREGQTQKNGPGTRPSPPSRLRLGLGARDPSPGMQGGCRSPPRAPRALFAPSSRDAAGVSKHGVSTGTLPSRARRSPGSPQRDSPSRRRRAASPPPRLRGAADLAASSSAKPLRQVHNPRRRGTSRALRPRPTLSGPRRVAAGRPRRDPSPTCPLGLFVGGRLSLGPGARRALRSPDRGRAAGVAEAAEGRRPRRARAGCVDRSRRVFVLF